MGRSELVCRAARARRAERGVSSLPGSWADAPNCKDFRGRTPLMVAIFSGNAEVCKQLLHERASLTVQDRAHMTACDYAVNSGHGGVCPGGSFGGMPQEVNQGVACGRPQRWSFGDSVEDGGEGPDDDSFFGSDLGDEAHVGRPESARGFRIAEWLPRQRPTKDRGRSTTRYGAGDQEAGISWPHVTPFALPLVAAFQYIVSSQMVGWAQRKQLRRGAHSGWQRRSSAHGPGMASAPQFLASSARLRPFFALIPDERVLFCD